jgi:hypothetical protein
MNGQEGLTDSLWCLVFSITSIGGWLWFCWGVGFPVQNIL